MYSILPSPMTCETFLGQYLDHGRFDITLDKVLSNHLSSS